MTKIPRRPTWPLLLMLVCHAPILLATASLASLGVLFGSEAYRSAGIPAIELLALFAPFLVAAGAALITIMLWKRDNRTAAYCVTAASVAAAILTSAVMTSFLI
jgi:hypothetical protein